MGRLIILLLLVLGIPWSIRAWWQMRRARGPKERAFIGRMSLAAWMLALLAGVILSVLKGQALLFALPVICVGGLAMQHGWKKARARIQAEEADPLSRARRIN
jgi:hypothetical protein